MPKTQPDLSSSFYFYPHISVFSVACSHDGDLGKLALLISHLSVSGCFFFLLGPGRGDVCSPPLQSDKQMLPFGAFLTQHVDESDVIRMLRSY